jgi:molybdopterin synthase catalytic subunit
MQRIKVLFFATLRDHAKTKSIELEIPEGMSVMELKERLVHEIPALREPMNSVVLSVNREFAFDENLVPGGAEVALFPPVSGG